MRKTKHWCKNILCVLFLTFFLLDYIQVIMTLEEAVQHVVMTAIQEVSSA